MSGPYQAALSMPASKASDMTRMASGSKDSLREYGRMLPMTASLANNLGKHSTAESGDFVR